MSEHISILSSLLYLANCAVKEEVPDREFLAQMDWKGVYEASAFHNLAAMTCMAVDSAVAAEDGFVLSEGQHEIYQKWQESKHRAVRKYMLMDMAVRQTEAFLEQSGIWYMLLKGSVLKDLYPKPGMRQMSDCDILFDPAYQQQVHDYFVSQGYEVECYQEGNHDVYVKAPVYNFEMHTSLFGWEHQKELEDYYSGIYSKLIVGEGSDYKRFFTPEDFYVYFIAHAYRHHSGGGVGLRTLVDIYVYLDTYKDTMDWTYVSEQLRILKIEDYEQHLRTAVRNIFVLEQFDMSEEDALLKYMYCSGTYGTLQNKVENKLKALSNGDKLTVATFFKYLWQRCYPGEVFLKERYPFFYRHKWARPFCPVVRMVKGLVIHPKSLVREFKSAVFHVRKR